MDRKCKECGEVKPITEYYKLYGKPRIVCKTCHKSKSKPSKKALHTWINKHKGVYGIFSNGVCLYVGESKRLLERRSKHWTWIKNDKHCPDSAKYLYPLLRQHTNLVFGILEECEDHKEKEQYYIDLYSPLYNGNKS